MEFIHRFRDCRRVSALVVAISACAMAHADMTVSTADPQLRRLMDPTPAELVSEEQGRVYIYDSLEINQVEAALDKNFERMQHMMFIRINHLPPSGAGPAVVEDDGCE